MGDLWYSFNNEDWLDVGRLKNDKDIINLINRSFQGNKRTLNVFVEHARDEAEIIGIAYPFLSFIGSGPIAKASVVGAIVDESVVGEPKGRQNIEEELGVGDDLGIDDDMGAYEDLGIDEDLSAWKDESRDQELGADELSGFSGIDVEESNLFSDIGSSLSRGEETSNNVDWFGVFLANLGEDDDGPQLEYKNSDEKHSHDGSDSEQPPRPKLHPEFNEETDIRK